MNKDLYAVLNQYGFTQPLEIKQIENKSVWEINNKYILKKSCEEKETKKVVFINNFLKEEGIPVFGHIKTVYEKSYTAFNGSIYYLMSKMEGKHIEYTNPFIGDYKDMAYSFGIEIARLHRALKKLGHIEDIYKSDLMDELRSALEEIKARNIDIPCEIITSCFELEKEYYLLPRQLIHRDIQFGNILFDKDRFTGFLDFDSSEESVRLFDIVYFGQSILFTNDYRDRRFIRQWSEFFSSLLCGYHSENKLYENEIKSIHKICVALQIIFISYYLYTAEKRELIPKRVDMMKWIYSNESVFTISLND